MSRLSLFLIIALALGLRFFHLSNQGYSLDESSSLFFSSTPGWRSLFWDNHPIFYPVILKIWLWIVPMTEAWTRSLSVLISVAGVFIMAKIGEIHGSKTRGLAMALAMAFSIMSIHHAQETRMYALFECLSALQLWSTLLLLESDTRRRRIFYIVSLFALVSTHLLGFLPALLTLYLVARAHPSLRRHLLKVLAIAAIIVTMTFFNLHWESLQWQWRLRESFKIEFSFLDLIANYTQGSLWFAPVMALSLLAAYFSRDLWARAISRQILRISIIAWIALELCLQFSPRDIFIPRYFIFFNPYLIFIFVLGLEGLRERISGGVQKWRSPAGRMVASGSLLGFITLFPIVYDYRTPAWNRVAQLVVDEQGKIVWTSRSPGLAVPYYSRAGIPVKQFVYDEDTIDQLKDAVIAHDVWVVDGFIGRYGYFEALSRDLVRAHLKVSAYEFDNSIVEPVFALRVWQDPSAMGRPIDSLTDQERQSLAPLAVPEPAKKKKSHGK